MLERRNKGFGLVEILFAIAIAIVLLAWGSHASNKNVEKANRESVESDLQIYASALADAYYDLGAPEMEAGASDADAKAAFTLWLQRVQEGYVSAQFDTSSITQLSNGWRVTTLTPTDVWGGTYTFWFISDAGMAKYAMIASAGGNGEIDQWNTTDQDFGDDIIVVINPKFN